MRLTRLTLPTCQPAVPPASTLERRSGRACRSRGAATVEFALVALLAFLPLLLATVELGRLFYLVTTTQEVTRRAARAQVVRWSDQQPAIQRHALFLGSEGDDALPGAPELAATMVRLEFFETYDDARNGLRPLGSGTAEANFQNCLKSLSPCIRYVRATLAAADGSPLRYRPVTGWFDRLFDLPLPGATVIMPAEALGLL